MSLICIDFPMFPNSFLFVPILRLFLFIFFCFSIRPPFYPFTSFSSPCFHHGEFFFSFRILSLFILPVLFAVLGNFSLLQSDLPFFSFRISPRTVLSLSFFAFEVSHELFSFFYFRIPSRTVLFGSLFFSNSATNLFLFLLLFSNS